MFGIKPKGNQGSSAIPESMEAKRQKVVDSINIIRTNDQRVGYIFGSTHRAGSDGYIPLVEDRGSPHTNHFAFMTKDGKYHLYSEIKYWGDDGQLKDVFRMRVFSKIEGEWICVTQEIPRAESIGSSVDSSQVEGGIIRSFHSDADYATGQRKPIKPWEPGIDPRLPTDALVDISPADEYSMTVVDRVLKVADSVQHRDLGRMTAEALFAGAA